MTKNARTRILTALSLGAIVVPALVGWNAATSNAQPERRSLGNRLFSNYQIGSTGKGMLKAVPLSVSELAALGIPQSGTSSTALQAQPFADAAFQKTWERTDKPVASGAVQRSWYWGPTPNTGALQEDYAEGAGGKRLVQYFDKSRMEINDPNADRNSKFFVTNGLLSVELISGKMQTGNSTYVDRYPADIPMASDADDANAPTYYSFQGVSNTPLGDHPANPKTGIPATSTITRNGTVGDDATKSTYPRVNFIYYDPNTKHNIPQAIWEFLNDSGPVYEAGSTVTSTGRLSDPWFYATGLPISEPYWARVKIAGQQQDVLIQAFERRVVTYVPNGVPGYKVQMGNIGQHYYDWRYKDAGHPQGNIATPTPIAGSTSVPATPTATSVPPTPTMAPPDCSDVPPAKSGTIKPLCGPVGTEYEITITGFTPGEKISYWFTLPDGEVVGTDEPIDIGNHPGTVDDYFDSGIFEGLPDELVVGLWYITYEGDVSHHQSVVYFKITPGGSGGGPGNTPTVTPTRDPNLSTCTDVPASINMTITPNNCSRVGTRFLFTGRGFQGGETLGVYLTAPDQSVFGAPFQVTADGNGVSEVVSVTTSSGFPLGVYALTMESLNTHTKAIGYFKLIP